MDMIEISNTVSDLGKMNEWLADLFSREDLPESLLTKFELVLEEAVTNVMFHGYDDDEGHRITIGASVENDTVLFRIEDSGREFNPLSVADPSKPDSIEDAAIGGLGIHFIRKIMDGMDYKREGDKNVFTFWKAVK